MRGEQGPTREGAHGILRRPPGCEPDDPSVVGVVGLAPWWSAQDPVHTLAGRSLVAAHGRRDRITSYAETRRYVERARDVAADATLHDMGALGHYMLTGVDRWNDVAVDASLRLLAPA